MVDSPSPPPPNDSAASSFAWFAARREAGEEIDFDVWIREHPEHQEELRLLHEDWQQPATLTLERSFFHRQADLESGEVSTGPLSPGKRVGEFQLVKQLGRGGMGEVWEAEQSSLSRRVALKLLLPGRGGDRAIEFFEREARAGGRLSHPGIVAIHASGEDEGLRWIAMELVEGGCTLAHFLEDMRKLDELPNGYYRQVVGFVAEIADAVAVAHEAGVIHRDLKPLNVLIGENDAPKVGDFGLARVVDELSLSMTGDFAGTYFYMSPEQVMARRMGIDYRSDIFSLGVMVYELLTLARPFQGDTTHQIAEQIVMHDPPDPRQIRSRVPTELAVICGKAMEKKPGDRYASMAELAADLRRYLNDEPILAKPPTVVQRTVKWLRRNPAKSATAAIAATALVAISLLWLRAEEATQAALQAKAATEVQRDKAQTAETKAMTALVQVEEEKQATAAALATAKTERAVALAAKKDAARQKVQAEQRAEQLQQVSNFQAGQLAGVDAAAMGLTIRAMVLERAEAKGQREALEKLLAGADFTGLALGVLEKEVFEGALEELDAFGNRPLVQARMLQVVAATLQKLGLLERALTPQEQALEIRRRELGDEHPDTLSSINYLGRLLLDLGKYAEADPLLRGALRVRRRVLGEQHRDTLISIGNMGSLLMAKGKFIEAEVFYREQLEGRRRTRGDDHTDTLTTIGTLGSLLGMQGKFTEAELLVREAMEGKRRKLGDDHKNTLISIGNLGGLLFTQGKLKEAEPLLREALAGCRRKLGDQHPYTLTTMGNLGNLHIRRGKYTEAEPLVREQLDGRRRVLGVEHPATLKCLTVLGTLRYRQGKFEEAEPLLRETLEVSRRKHGDEHESTLRAIADLGTLLMARGKYIEAIELFREQLDWRRRTRGAEHRSTLDAMGDVGYLLTRTGKLEEAEPLLRGALQALRRKLGDEHLLTLRAINNLGYLLTRTGKLEEAEPLLRAALKGRRRKRGDEHLETLTSIYHLARVLLARNKLDECEELARELIGARPATDPGHVRGKNLLDAIAAYKKK